MAQSVTKAELVSSIADATGLTKADAERALVALLGGIQKGLVEQGRVTLVGFGTFQVTERAARVGRNPRTKQPIPIPAGKFIRFKPGARLKGAVN